MKYAVEILPSALKELGKLDKRLRKRIDTHIRALAEVPRPPGVAAMQGASKGLFRIVVGNYRIIYEINDERLIVLIIKIGHRREVYR